MQKTALIALVGVLVATIVAVPAHAAGTIDTEAEQRALALVNDERSSRGIATLKVDNDLVAVARDHSRDMASDGELYHNENLGNEVSGYAKLGENVGYGPNADEVHGGFMGSQTHRHNIVDDDFTKVGIGVVRDGDLVWITQVFMQPAGGSPSGGGTSGGSSGSGSSGSSTQRDAPRATAPPVPSVTTVQAATTSPVRRVEKPRDRARTRGPLAGQTLSMLESLAAGDVAIDAGQVVLLPMPTARPSIRPVYWE